MKVVVLATSYPRSPDDMAGRFVLDAVEGVRARGVDVEVVSPASFTHFGIAYGDGIAQNLRTSPWKLALVPGFLAAYARAARRAAAGADLVHAHWIPSALAARATGKPYVLQVWGTDVELARRVPTLVRPLVRGARLVLAASSALADAARALGAREVRMVPSGVAIPAAVGASEEPPHVLYVGRLSREKGIADFLAATEGLPRRVVGAGPIGVPEAAGFVPPGAVGAWYERAAVVCVPSLREGYGMTAREAMAHGRAVVATRVGGLVDAIEDGADGVLVPPGDRPRLRQAVEALLADASERNRLGAAARESARRRFSREAELDALLEAYGEALDGVRQRRT